MPPSSLNYNTAKRTIRICGDGTPSSRRDNPTFKGGDEGVPASQNRQILPDFVIGHLHSPVIPFDQLVMDELVKQVIAQSFPN